MINQYGGEMAGAVGVPEEQLRQAATSAVCKVNIDSDGRLAMTAKAREYFALHPGHFDPRQWLGPGREALMQLVMRKNQEVLGSAGWGSQIAKAILAAEQG
jgi:fructose-bisphosphate aldolase class II